MISRLFYRSRQFIQSLVAEQPTRLLVEVEELLTPSQYSLFESMSDSEKSHGLRVYATMKDDGEINKDVLIAGLLHDVGKSKYGLNVIERVLVVVVDALFPGLMNRLAEGNALGWRKPFVVKVMHPAWGAEMALDRGVSDLTAFLIKNHQRDIEEVGQEDEDMYQLLAALKSADDRS